MDTYCHVSKDGGVNFDRVSEKFKPWTTIVSGSIHGSKPYAHGLRRRLLPNL